MKRFSLLVAFASVMILAVTTNSQAQTDNNVTTSRWSIGPKAGITMAHFWGNDVNNNANPRVAEQFGAFVTWSNDRWYAVTGEFLFSSKGSRFRNDNFFFDDVRTATRVSYIEMPVLFRAFLMRDGVVRPHLSAGPSLGILVLATTKGVDPSTDATSFYSNTNKVDVGMNFGGGVNIKVNKIWINPELRYNLGLVNVVQDNSVRNGALTLSVGVGFPIGKGALSDN